MIDYQFKSGNKKVLLNGTVVTYKDEDLELVCDPDDKHKSYFKLIFSFSETKDKKPMIVPQPTGDSGLRLEMVNFRNILGMGPVDPIKIARTKGADLYLAFQVHSMTTAKAKLIHYTLYQVPVSKARKDDKKKQ